MPEAVRNVGQDPWDGLQKDENDTVEDCAIDFCYKLDDAQNHQMQTIKQELETCEHCAGLMSRVSNTMQTEQKKLKESGQSSVARSRDVDALLKNVKQAYEKYPEIFNEETLSSALLQILNQSQYSEIDCSQASTISLSIYEAIARKRRTATKQAEHLAYDVSAMNLLGKQFLVHDPKNTMARNILVR